MRTKRDGAIYFFAKDNLEFQRLSKEFKEGFGRPEWSWPRGVAKLKTIVSGYERQVILAPYPGMKTKIALTAWTRLDAFDELDERRVRRFISAYRGIDHHPR